VGRVSDRITVTVAEAGDKVGMIADHIGTSL